MSRESAQLFATDKKHKIKPQAYSQTVSILSFTQPVLVESQLRRDPVAVKIGEHALTIARSSRGVFAYPERCPHRGTRLVHAHNDDGRLVCPYHGWSVSFDGQVRKPNQTQSECHLQVHRLERAFGSYWLVDPTIPVPISAPPRHTFCGSMQFDLSAPYHVVLDNFNEGSHTPFVHSVLGPNPNDLHRIHFEWKNEADCVLTHYDGPQRHNLLFFAMAPFRELHWSITWKTFFAPTYMQYDSKWYHPKTGRVLTENRVYYYLVPKGLERTSLHAFIFVKAPAWLAWLTPAVKLVSRLITANQVLEDERFYPKIADLPHSFKGLRLEATDHPVVAIRRRANAEYLGRSGDTKTSQ